MEILKQVDNYKGFSSYYHYYINSDNKKILHGVCERHSILEGYYLYVTYHHGNHVGLCKHKYDNYYLGYKGLYFRYHL